MPARHDLLREGAAGPRPRALLREPRYIRHPRAGAQGVDQVHEIRGSLRGARRPGEALQEDVLTYEFVAIGASWGGLQAVETVLGGLPDGFSTPIAIA